MTTNSKLCKRCLTDKPTDEYHKNKAQADGKHIYCRDCVSEMNKESYERHKERRLEKAKKYREEKGEKIREYLRGYIKGHYKKNKDRYAAYHALRKKRKTFATPDWLTDAQRVGMESVYTTARILTEETGVKHEVDHIVPIKGKTVCGLHVPCNLQVLTKTENTSKGNREWPDMW